MQWNVNETENWEELRSFVDTALLPIYLYRGSEEVSEHVLRMNYLLNVAAAIEQKLKGRVLLYPVHYHFAEEQPAQQTPPGFVHNVLLHFRSDRVRVAELGTEGSVLTLPVGEEDLESSLRFEVTVDVLYKEIIRHWQQRSTQ
ncbi:DUF2487 family protein [Brevibacillus choshinensis]|uniref:DUF2487 family protein n=1 Tax=Brevibacillus choshinensis TaxID=54911 RepID=UPI002E236D0C|nr:DUF2487 family protein [Brevibacillus choshinensis]MED4783173.1 DUF2487 family protein [Brevibacillus choshinensis]